MNEKMQLITHKPSINWRILVLESKKVLFLMIFSRILQSLGKLWKIELHSKRVNDFSLKMRVLVKITIYVFVNKMRTSYGYEVKKPILETIIVAFECGLFVRLRYRSFSGSFWKLRRTSRFSGLLCWDFVVQN